MMEVEQIPVDLSAEESAIILCLIHLMNMIISFRAACKIVWGIGAMFLAQKII